ncbi:MAG TPA: CAP domain-containing protein [Gaiellaceae bacterium]|nr:CAP domain-containing protein [Gaiellaceae bacterium]
MTVRGGFRVSAVLAVLAAAAVLAGVLAPAGRPATTQPRAALTALDAGVLDQLNQIRVGHGLVPLKLSPALTASATQHTQEMGVDGYFEHTSFDGTVFWKRIQRWYASNRYGYWSVGENLLWSSPDVDAPQALQLWMNSPEHRANILAPRWREIGIAAEHFTTAGGTYGNLPVTIITTDFGVRH